jgi:hypothetical protein
MRKLIYGGKFAVTIAATWAIGASLYIFFSPMSAQIVTGRHCLRRLQRHC